MKRVIFKLTLCFFALITLVLLFSIEAPKKIDAWSAFDGSSIMVFLYIIVYKGIFTALIPPLLAIGYSSCLFNILKSNPKQQLILMINCISVMLLSVAMALFVFFCTHWFLTIIITKFIETIIVINLLVLIMYFAFKKNNPNQLSWAFQGGSIVNRCLRRFAFADQMWQPRTYTNCARIKSLVC